MRRFGNGLGVVSGNPTSGDMGVGTVNVSGSVNVNGISVVRNQPSPANSSGTAGLSSSLTYMTPAFVVPVNGPLASGQTWRVKFWLTTTGAVGAPTLTLTMKFGTAGTTADATVCTVTLPVGQVFTADMMAVTCTFVVKTVNAVTGSVIGVIETVSTASLGLTNSVTSLTNNTAGSLNTTVPGFVGVAISCVNPGPVSILAPSFEVVGGAG